ncbi:MAG: hypothetical protein EOL93_01900 [Epsilonproteobacteria bacterium]|nr:hypothetical protein [Campylobacterota bacterium]
MLKIITLPEKHTCNEKFSVKPTIFNMQFVEINEIPYTLIWDLSKTNSEYRTVTNSAKSVVRHVIEYADKHNLKLGRLLYKDSVGTWDELIVENRCFARFKSIGYKYVYDLIEHLSGITGE